MNSAIQSDFFSEHAWLLPDTKDLSSLSGATRRIAETRILAALFKRRLPLLAHWRRQTILHAGERTAPPAPVLTAGASANSMAVTGNLPEHMPVLDGEVSILRAFLGVEINAILFGEAK